MNISAPLIANNILPNGNHVNVNELVEMFKEEQRVPFPTSAIINIENDQARSCNVQWEFNDYDRIKKVNFTTDYMITYKDNKLTEVHELLGQIESNIELNSVVSESGQYRVSINKSTGNQSDSSSNQILNIWNHNENTIIKSIDVSLISKHDAICLNDRFVSSSFSPDETRLLYVAEKKIKHESYFKNIDLFDEKSKKDDTERGNEYEYKQDWGEQLDGLSHSCVCILTFRPELNLKVIELPHLTLAQPFWLDDKTIGFIAIQENPKRLGLVYCTNRVTYLYKCRLASSDQDVKDDFEIIRGEKDDLNLMGVRINPRRDKVVWLENQAGGPHRQANRLKLWSLKTGVICTVFDDDEHQQPIVRSLFVQNASAIYWSRNGENVLVQTVNHSKNIICVINVDDKRVRVIDCDLEDTLILSFKNDFLVIAASSPNHAPVLIFGLIDFKQKHDNEKIAVDFKQIAKKTSIKNDKIAYRIIKQNENRLLDQVETILIGQADSFETPSSAIIWPHGGPHSANCATYDRTIAYFVRLSFKVALINYRGSLGITGDYISQLCANIGEMEINDVMSSIENLIKLNLIDKNNLHLHGRSHGGYIVLDLIGQYPSYFASCTAINPVTDISKMFGVTDIPDWCLIETFGVDVNTYKKINNWPEENNLVKQLNRIINVGKPELLKSMFDRSPIRNIDNVNTPVLMILGKLDKRVPHSSQGLSYMNALKVRNVETKCLIYPDNHSVAQIPFNGDSVINAIHWILDHSKR